MTYEDLLTEAVASATYQRHPAPRSLLRVHGPDAAEFLHRLCSQDVEGMGPETSAPAAFLNAKGKLVGTCQVGSTADALWLDLASDELEALAENLDRYHFTERLAIERSDTLCGEVVGRDAPGAVGLPVGACRALDGGGVVFTGARRGLTWVRYHAPASFFAAPPWSELGLPPLEDEVGECLRICAGIPRVGTDTEEGTLALEADLDDHVSTTKGCYTGQEIVARIHTYGHVNRKLVVLTVGAEADVAVGTPLLEAEDGIAVGRLMSSALLPDGARRVGLGYLPPDFWEAGTALRVGDAEGPEAQVVGLGPEQANAT